MHICALFGVISTSPNSAVVYSKWTNIRYACLHPLLHLLEILCRCDYNSEKSIFKSTRADKTNFRKGICADKTDVRQLYLKIIMQFYKKHTYVWKDNWKVWSSVLDSAVNSLWMPIQFYFPQFVTPHKPAVVYLFGGIKHRECEIFGKSIFKSIRADKTNFRKGICADKTDDRQ